MKYQLSLTVFLLAVAGILPAQRRMAVPGGCAVDDAEMARNHYVFDPDDEAVQIMAAIMEVNILDPNFEIMAGDVSNALATMVNGKRYIIYNTAYIERIKSSAGADWAAFFVFAHEIGHHLNNHRFDLTDPNEKKEQELRADVYAGGMLYRLGATLDQAQSGVTNACREQESESHPPRSARLAAVANGWKRAKTQNPTPPAPFTLPTSGATPGKSATPTTPSDDPLGLVYVRGGDFNMGCTSEQQDCNDDEKPAHSVHLSDYYIGKYEVTQALWRDIMGSDPKELYFKGCDQCPVERVSWDDVQEFIKKLNARYPGRNYRLPTEAEWEYAARERGKAVLFGNGKNILDPAAANFDGDWNPVSYSVKGIDRQKTTPVGSFAPNSLGLYDMSGNVWEWCSDWYGSDYYSKSPGTNPQGPTSGSFRVCRGGSWLSDPQGCRVAVRLYSGPGDRNNSVGFRLARTK